MSRLVISVRPRRLQQKRVRACHVVLVSDRVTVRKVQSPFAGSPTDPWAPGWRQAMPGQAGRLSRLRPKVPRNESVTLGASVKRWTNLRRLLESTDHGS